MDRNVFIAVVLCAGIFVVWQQVYMKPYQKAAEEYRATHSEQVQAQEATKSVEGARSTETLSSSNSHHNKIQNSKVSSVKLGSDDYNVSISTAGAVVENVTLNEYKRTKTANLPFLIGSGEQLQLSFSNPEFQYLSKVNYAIKSQGKNSDGLQTASFVYEDENVLIERNYIFDQSIFELKHEAKFNFKKTVPSILFIGAQALKDIPKEHSENENREVLFNKTGDQEHWSLSGFDSTKEELGDGNWAGFSSRYFMKALVDKGSSVRPQFQAKLQDSNVVQANLVYKVPGQSFHVPVSLYYGPKDTEVLQKVGGHLNMAVDFGWFTFVAIPLLKGLKWLYKHVHNYGIAIILLTIFVKLLTYPLTYKSMKSMKDMQRIQPQLARLRERYKDDKEKLNKEMLQLMRANGYNPMSGCFPILIQMPVFFALYRVLFGAIDLYGQPFFGWIQDLSAKDPFFVTPVLLAIIMFLQQKMTPTTTTDPAQQKMMMMMPVIFGVMMLWLPSGLTLYMLINSLVSILQQVLINKKIGIKQAAGVVST
ncbi:MAG: membrane protein insertase YidC [Bacteriovoracia bacterium]